MDSKTKRKNLRNSRVDMRIKKNSMDEEKSATAKKRGSESEKKIVLKKSRIENESGSIKVVKRDSSNNRENASKKNGITQNENLANKRKTDLPVKETFSRSKTGNAVKKRLSEESSDFEDIPSSAPKKPKRTKVNSKIATKQQLKKVPQTNKGKQVIKKKSEVSDKQNSPVKAVKELNEDSSSSESDWEEVADDSTADIDDYKPDIPDGGVEITLEGPKLHQRREKKKFDMMAYIRCEINRSKRENQLAVHQVHLLCLISRGFYVNGILNCDDLKGFALSFVPQEFCAKNTKRGEEYIKKLINWFRSTFTINPNYNSSFRNVKAALIRSFQCQVAFSASVYNMMFVCLVRSLGLNARLCFSLYPISYKPKDLLRKKVLKPETIPNGESKKVEVAKEQPGSSKTSNPKQKDKNVNQSKQSKSIPKTVKPPKAIDKDFESKRKVSRRFKKNVSYKLSSDEENDNEVDEEYKAPNAKETSDISSDEENQKTKKKKLSTSSTRKTKPQNRKILSSDSDQEPSKSSGLECWAEVLIKSSEKWISVECSENIVDKPYQIEKLATQPVTYILAFDIKSHVKDVTKRYCFHWMTKTRKLRVEPDWWEETLDPYLPPDNKQNREEDSQIESTLLRKPFPEKIGDFKNHPLYFLKRHLLKFQAIYPPDAPTLGFLKKEPIYSRECVHQLHSRETWVKEARMVRIGEEPYKIVKARPKWDRVSGICKTDLPLPLFGKWQTEEYMPPIAHNGKVPRNEYGNVELFKPCMLPIGTVHLRNPGLNRIAKKLGIDCSPAVVGFDGHGGSIHAVYDGFVICEEFKDTMLAAWDEEQVNIQKREREKYEKRVYGNWKKLIKGLLIREKIKAKYLSN